MFFGNNNKKDLGKHENFTGLAFTGREHHTQLIIKPIKYQISPWDRNRSCYPQILTHFGSGGNMRTNTEIDTQFQNAILKPADVATE
ncbi:MAG TPA: hypothetical protein VMW95_08860, partial [Desulfobacterales bacterium]|nr:hypothetical protein [Desulfobacterales bacterium]